MWGRYQRQHKVSRLEGEIQRLVADRRPEEAIPLQREAIALVREIVSEQPTPGSADLRMLGALLYGYAITMLNVDMPMVALTALNDAEECYRTLRGLGEADMDQLIADVKLRRARVLHMNGRLALAIFESAAALHMMTPPPEDDASAREQYDLDRARMLLGNATILSPFGDPDLASESADAAIRLLLLRREQINVSDTRDYYVDMLREAATLAQELHAGQGRTEVALAAGSVAVDTFELAPATRVVPLRGSSSPLPAFRRRALAKAAMQHGLLLVSAGRQSEGAGQIALARQTDAETADVVEAKWTGTGAGPISLATALGTARRVLGEQQVPDELLRLAPKTGLPGAPLTPSERCSAQERDLMARSLARVSLGLPRWSGEALRIGFEANCLFALSSSDDQPDVTQWHEKNAGSWATMLEACIDACDEQTNVKLGSEFRVWLGEAASVVDPFRDLHDGRG